MEQAIWNFLSLNMVYILIHDTLSSGQDRRRVQKGNHEKINGKKMCSCAEARKQATYVKVTYPMRS